MVVEDKKFIGVTVSNEQVTVSNELNFGIMIGQTIDIVSVEARNSKKHYGSDYWNGNGGGGYRGPGSVLFSHWELDGRTRSRGGGGQSEHGSHGDGRSARGEGF